MKVLEFTSLNEIQAANFTLTFMTIVDAGTR